MNATVSFLRHILPDEGFYVAHTIAPVSGARWNTFFNTIEELADYLLKSDAKGLTVYHACASYRVNQRDPMGTPAKARRLGRTQHNVLWVASLWGDIDVGPDKIYRTFDEAVQAVYAFCKSTLLPFPTLVSSGGGLHIYWPLDDYLRADVWRELATGLRALFNQKGLAVDQSRTSDASSILRPPGTHNRKTNVAREVACGKLNGPYPVETFEFLKGLKPDGPPRYVNGHQPRLVADALNLFSNDKADGTLIADGCRQLGQLRDTHGNIPEPAWYACLGVLAHCGDEGHSLAYEWSSGYPDYTRDETSEKLARAGQYGPTTCAKFAAVNPAGCAGCPYDGGKITSPIVLGRNQKPVGNDSPGMAGGEDQLRSQPDPIQLRSQPDPIIAAPFEIQQIKIPDGFRLSQTGALVAISEHAKGAIIETVISANPLYLIRINKNENRTEFSSTFAHYTLAMGWHEVTLDNKVLYSSHGASELFGKGINIHDETQFRRYYKGHIDMLTKEKETLDLRYEQFGWKDDDKAFLYGLNLYGPNGVQKVAGNDELEYRVAKQEVGVTPGAKIAVWTSAIDGLFAKGAEPQSVSMLASFGAVLVRLLEPEEGGCILHYVTPETGGGKTWALLGSISVWGRKWGISSHSDDTGNSKSATRGALGNLPVFNDELLMRDPEKLKQYLRAFTDGRSKQRLNRSGKMIHDEMAWQTIQQSASNMSLLDILGKDAMRWRVIELSSVMPREVKMAQGERFRVLLRTNAGIAGHVFLQWLTIPVNLEWTKDQLQRVRDYLYETPPWKDPNNKYRYWIRAVSCMFVAGMICNRLGILNVDTTRVIKWLTEQLPFETDDERQRSLAVETISEYLRIKAKTGTLHMPGPWRPGETPPQPIQSFSQELQIRHEDKGGRYYIANKPLNDWLIEQGTIGLRDLVKELIDRKIALDKNRLVTLGAGTEWASGGPVRCLIVDGLHPDMKEVKPQ